MSVLRLRMATVVAGVLSGAVALQLLGVAVAPAPSRATGLPECVPSSARVVGDRTYLRFTDVGSCRWQMPTKSAELWTTIVTVGGGGAGFPAWQFGTQFTGGAGDGGRYGMMGLDVAAGAELIVTVGRGGRTATHEQDGLASSVADGDRTFVSGAGGTGGYFREPAGGQGAGASGNGREPYLMTLPGFAGSYGAGGAPAGVPQLVVPGSGDGAPAGSSAVAGASGVVIVSYYHAPMAAPMAAPTAVQAVPGDREAVVSWTAPAPPANGVVVPVTGYTVTATPGGQTCSTSEVPGTYAPPATSCTVSGLTNGTAHTFTVTARNVAGTGPASAPSAAVTPTAGAVPGAPTGVRAVPGNGSVMVSWTAPASSGGAPVIDYSVNTQPGGLTCTAVVPATSCTVSGLTNGTAHTFTVTARNVAGTGPASAPSAAVTPTAGAVPGAPTGVRVEPDGWSQSSVKVSWLPALAPAGWALDRYEIDGLGALRVVSPPPVDASGRASSIVTGLSAGTRYFGRVSSVWKDRRGYETVYPGQMVSTWTRPVGVSVPAQDRGRVLSAARNADGSVSFAWDASKLVVPAGTQLDGFQVVWAECTGTDAATATCPSQHTGSGAVLSGSVSSWTSPASGAGSVPAGVVRAWLKVVNRITGTTAVTDPGAFYETYPVEVTVAGQVPAGCRVDWVAQQDGRGDRWQVLQVTPRPGSNGQCGRIAVPQGVRKVNVMAVGGGGSGAFATSPLAAGEVVNGGQGGQVQVATDIAVVDGGVDVSVGIGGAAPTAVPAGQSAGSPGTASTVGSLSAAGGAAGTVGAASSRVQGTAVEIAGLRLFVGGAGGSSSSVAAHTGRYGGGGDARMPTWSARQAFAGVDGQGGGGGAWLATPGAAITPNNAGGDGRVALWWKSPSDTPLPAASSPRSGPESKPVPAGTARGLVGTPVPSSTVAARLRPASDGVDGCWLTGTPGGLALCLLWSGLTGTPEYVHLPDGGTQPEALEQLNPVQDPVGPCRADTKRDDTNPAADDAVVAMDDKGTLYRVLLWRGDALRNRTISWKNTFQAISGAQMALWGAGQGITKIHPGDHATVSMGGDPGQVVRSAAFDISMNDVLSFHLSTGGRSGCQIADSTGDEVIDAQGHVSVAVAPSGQVSDHPVHLVAHGGGNGGADQDVPAWLDETVNGDDHGTRMDVTDSMGQVAGEPAIAAVWWPLEQEGTFYEFKRVENGTAYVYQFFMGGKDGATTALPRPISSNASGSLQALLIGGGQGGTWDSTGLGGGVTYVSDVTGSDLQLSIGAGGRGWDLGRARTSGEVTTLTARTAGGSTQQWASPSDAFGRSATSRPKDANAFPGFWSAGEVADGDLVLRSMLGCPGNSGPGEPCRALDLTPPADAVEPDLDGSHGIGQGGARSVDRDDAAGDGGSGGVILRFKESDWLATPGVKERNEELQQVENDYLAYMEDLSNKLISSGAAENVTAGTDMRVNVDGLRSAWSASRARGIQTRYLPNSQPMEGFDYYTLLAMSQGFPAESLNDALGGQLRGPWQYEGTPLPRVMRDWLTSKKPCAATTDSRPNGRTVVRFSAAGVTECEWVIPNGVSSVNYLIVGGGGGGSAGKPNTPGSGGNGGQVSSGSRSVTGGQRVTLTIGAGGAGSVFSTTGNTGKTGGPSIARFDTQDITATGGSGGRGDRTTPGLGASGRLAPFPGRESSISGTSLVYGSGGGMATTSRNPLRGGDNAGWGGSQARSAGTAGNPGFGGGGGGSINRAAGGHGGSGAVVFSFTTLPAPSRILAAPQPDVIGASALGVARNFVGAAAQAPDVELGDFCQVRLSARCPTAMKNLFTLGYAARDSAAGLAAAAFMYAHSFKFAPLPGEDGFLSDSAWWTLAVPGALLMVALRRGLIAEKIAHVCIACMGNGLGRGTYGGLPVGPSALVAWVTALLSTTAGLDGLASILQDYYDRKESLVQPNGESSMVPGSPTKTTHLQIEAGGALEGKYEVYLPTPVRCVPTYAIVKRMMFTAWVSGVSVRLTNSSEPVKGLESWPEPQENAGVSGWKALDQGLKADIDPVALNTLLTSEQLVAALSAEAAGGTAPVMARHDIVVTPLIGCAAPAAAPNRWSGPKGKPLSNASFTLTIERQGDGTLRYVGVGDRATR